jgi:hypothetical protein
MFSLQKFIIEKGVCKAFYQANLTIHKKEYANA